MDALPPEHRALWTISASMKKTSFSGSAWVGGILSDRHGYLLNFFVCAVVQFICQAFLIPVSVLQRRQRERQRAIVGQSRVHSRSHKTRRLPTFLIVLRIIFFSYLFLIAFVFLSCDLSNPGARDLK